ncbi:MAG: KOW domain-containing RNA-binding protein [Clostridia bacterium]|nr:KOW domain-containing RNA-binding protein [Clostridia bacterium]
MDYIRGLVVNNKAGRDKGRFFVVISCDEKYADICDGKYRRLEKPKHKNIKHLSATKTVLNEEDLKSNRSVRKALAAFNNK